MELPEWYDQLAADEAKLDARIIGQSKLDPYNGVTELERRAVLGCEGTELARQTLARMRAERETDARHYCPTCGLFHRAVCPSGPGVADILSAPTPEPSFDLPCEEDDES